MPYTGRLAERDALLVIDNREHVVSAGADLVAGLTARLPHPASPRDEPRAVMGRRQGDVPVYDHAPDIAVVIDGYNADIA